MVPEQRRAVPAGDDDGDDGNGSGKEKEKRRKRKTQCQALNKQPSRSRYCGQNMKCLSPGLGYWRFEPQCVVLLRGDFVEGLSHEEISSGL